jgi:ferredoxin
MNEVRIELNPAKCQSYGRCLALAPTVFAWDRSRKVRRNSGEGAPGELILKAAKNCPYRAIAVIDAASGEQIFPLARKT